MKTYSRLFAIASAIVAVCSVGVAQGQDNAAASVLENTNVVIQDGNAQRAIIEGGAVQGGVVQDGGAVQNGLMIQNGGAVNYADGAVWNSGGNYSDGCCNNGVTYSGHYGGYNDGCCNDHYNDCCYGGFSRPSYGRPGYGRPSYGRPSYGGNDCCTPSYGRRPIYGRR